MTTNGIHLSADGLTLLRANRKVLDGITFAAKPGELIGIIGPNGAGKSTLLKCLNGVVRADSGTVSLDGISLARLGTRNIARQIALMHQSSDIAFPLTVAEVVMLGRYPYQGRFQSATAHDHDLVARSMNYTDTTHLAERALAQLSGGERQRVMLAKVLAQDCPAVLLDEPTASLDLAHQEQIFSMARALADAGRTILCAVHDLRLASRWCHKLLLLADGAIVAWGSPAEVLTEMNLSRAYRVRVRVWHNQITGLLDFHLCDPATETSRPHVHVIGGGGSAVGVLRLLGDQGYRVSTGVLAPGDSDLQVASAYGVPVITSAPFSPIGDSAFEDNCQLAAKADLTILCALALGSQNLRNLEAAACASHLLVLDDGEFATRDFSGGTGLPLFERLKARAVVMHPRDLPHWIETWQA